MTQKIVNKVPTRYELFVVVSLLGTIPFFVYAFFAGANAFDWLCIDNFGGFEFGDYFQHMYFMQDAKHIYVNIEGEWGAFPPLIYLFYIILFRFTHRNGSMYPDWYEYKNSEYSLLVFLFYSILITLIFLYGVKLWAKQNNYRMMFVCLLLSTPYFAGAYERGNSAMIVVVLLLVALNWRDSESKIKRELAMVLIAVCAGIKIYPAIFGLLYLKEKRWKEALRLLIYGIVIFFLPFLFFLGKDGLILWLSNIIDTFKVDCIGRVQFIKGVVNTGWYLITRENVEVLGTSASIFFLFIMVFLSFLSSSKSRTVFFLCASMTFFPSNAFRYTLCYLAIPLIIELMENGDEMTHKGISTLETVFYGLVFTIPTYFGAATLFRLNFNENYPRTTCVEVWIYLMAYILMAIVVIHEIIDVIKHKNYNPSFKRILKE